LLQNMRIFIRQRFAAVKHHDDDVGLLQVLPNQVNSFFLNGIKRFADSGRIRQSDAKTVYGNGVRD